MTYSMAATALLLVLSASPAPPEPGVLEGFVPLLERAPLTSSAIGSVGEAPPGAWCPTSLALRDWLRARDRMRPVAASLAGREHGLEPRIVERDGIFVLEDNGTLLAHDNPFDLEGTSLLLTPGPADWRVEQKILGYEEGDPGTQIFQGRNGWHVETVDLASMTFPFAGRDHTTLYVTSTTAVAFEPPEAPGASQLLASQVLRDRSLRLAPMQFGTSLFGRSAWLREEADRAVITWQADGGNTLDVQAVLYADGRVAFHYKNVGWPEHGAAVVVDGNDAWWADRASAGEATDPGGDAAVDPPDGPALDLTALRAEQVSGSEVLYVELDLVEAPPAATDGVLYWLLDLRDEPGDDPFRTIWLVWEDGSWNWTNEAVEIDGTTLRVMLLASEMPLTDDDFEITANAWRNDGNWAWSDAITLEVVPPEPPRPVMRDISREATFTEAGPLFEAFTLPELLPYAVYDALGRHLRDPAFDSVAIYQNFKTDLKFYAGGYSTVGNAAADGIGVGSAGDPPAPGLLHLDQIRTGWNGSDSGKVTLLNHEFGHHWLYFFHIDEGGVESNALNPASAHPAGWVHTPASAPVYDATDASTMGGSNWIDNGDGTFTSPNRFASFGYSWHELYLMGLAAAGEVQDWWYIANPDPGLPSSYWPGAGVTVTGNRVPVAIDQVVAIHGPRAPAYPDAPSAFTVPMVLVVRPGAFSDADVQEVARTCEVWAPKFADATMQRGSVRCALNPPDGVILDPAAAPVIQVGGSLAFLGEGSDPDGDAVDLEWDFAGVSGPATGPGPHDVTFAQAGSYEVLLKTVDATGQWDPTPATMTVTVECIDPVDEVTGLRVRREGEELRITWQDLAGAPDDYLVLDAGVAWDPFQPVDAAASGNPGVLRPRGTRKIRFFQVAARNLPDCLGPY